MSNETQQAEKSLKIRKSVLECEDRMKNASQKRQESEQNLFEETRQKHGISFYLEKHGYNAKLLQCTKKDKKFSWRNKQGVLYIQVSEPHKDGRFYTAWFVEL